MKIKGKVHCFFEQSGTFKNEFIKLGIPAEDYDIQDNFGQTDHVIDLFKQIEIEYDKERQGNARQCKTIFDDMTNDDLIVAFFPCIYFNELQMNYYRLNTNNNRHKPESDRIVDAIERLHKRTYFHTILYKLVWCAKMFELRLIIENPCTKPHYLIDSGNFPEPTIIDKNRMMRGDFFRKPTAYWFFNCEPTRLFTLQNDKTQKIIDKCKEGAKAGICSEERSIISPDYARNFICDFILGKKQDIGQLSLF